MKQLLHAGLLAVVLCGCQTTSQNSRPLTRDEIDNYTSVRWLVTQPILRPVGQDKMCVYLRVRNSAGIEVPLQAVIASDLKARGYRVTQNLEDAWYYLNVDVRHVNKGRLPDLGAVATGGSVGAPASSRTGQSPANSQAASRSFAQQVSSGDVSMVVDIVAGERVPKGTITREVSNRGTQTQGESGDGATRGGSSSKGSATGTLSVDVQQVTTEDILVFYANRAAAVTKNSRVDLDEALPSLTQRLGKAMASALP